MSDDWEWERVETADGDKAGGAESSNAVRELPKRKENAIGEVPGRQSSSFVAAAARAVSAHTHHIHMITRSTACVGVFLVQTYLHVCGVCVYLYCSVVCKCAYASRTYIDSLCSCSTEWVCSLACGVDTARQRL